MEQNFYEATRPALNKEKPTKEGWRVSRWLLRHPRFILPFIVGVYSLFFASMSTLVIFYNNGI